MSRSFIFLQLKLYLCVEKMYGIIMYMIRTRHAVKLKRRHCNIHHICAVMWSHHTRYRVPYSTQDQYGATDIINIIGVYGTYRTAVPAAHFNNIRIPSPPPTLAPPLPPTTTYRMRYSPAACLHSSTAQNRRDHRTHLPYLPYHSH